MNVEGWAGNERSEKQLELLAQTRLNATDSRVRDWFGDRAVLENLKAELAEQVRRIYDRGLAGQFRTYCQIPGAGTEDYKNAWLELPDDGWALCGIRFRGLDLQRPFVDLVGSSRLNGPPEGIEPIVRAAEERYRVFRPLHLRVFVAGHRSALASQIKV